MSESNQYDLVVVGGGPGGYVAAARAGQLGMKTALVDKYERLGGVCLNYGCIPSKTLLDSSEYYALARHTFPGHGIKIKGLDLDLKILMKRKEEVIQTLTDNVRTLLKGSKVTVYSGVATFLSPSRLKVTETGGSGEQVLNAKNILLATGSTPVELSAMPFNGKTIINSTDALSLTKIPEHLVVVGGGYIGLELGSVWARLGAKVTVLEMQPQIAGTMDGQIGRTLTRILKKQGLDIRLGTRVLSAQTKRNKAVVAIALSDGSEESLVCDKLLVAVGRKPYTRELGLEAANLSPNAYGGLDVDASFRTTVKTIYAIGDLVRGPMLAHKASAEGRAAVENMAGMAGFVNYDAIPSVVYTAPEAASVGMAEEMVKERKIAYCKGTYPFTGAGRARCLGETDGLVKILSHKKTDRILGVHIIGARAADMIAEAVLAMETGASAEDVGRVIHGHPTFSEALQEAAMTAGECSIYSG